MHHDLTTNLTFLMWLSLMVIRSDSLIHGLHMLPSWHLRVTQIYHDPYDGQWLALGSSPAAGRRSRPRPTPSRLRSHWCSPLPSFCWRRSSPQCPRTGSLSRRWTPTCVRHRKHPVRPISTSEPPSTPADHPVNPKGKVMQGVHSSRTWQQYISRGHMCNWL